MSGTVHEFPDVDNGEGLTERQRLILETIRASVTDRGYPPSMREIGESWIKSWRPKITARRRSLRNA